MKLIKFLTSLLFAVILSLFVGAATQSPNASIAAFAVLTVGTVLMSVSKFNTVGLLGEFLVIDANDSPETKAAKDTFNKIHTELKNHTDKVGKELKDSFEGEVKKAITQNSELKGQLDKAVEEFKSMHKEHEDALVELNRFRSQASENEAKGVSFKDGLDKAIDEHKDALEAMSAKRERKISMELKAVGDMGLSSISNLTAANVQVAPGIVPYPNRQVHMREIIPTGRMATTLFNFLKEIGFDGAIATWAENSGNKSQFDVQYKEVSAPSQFIAGWVRISRKSLDDIPALKASLANRLLQKYLDAEDNQILSGDGTGANLLGLFNAANSFAYSGGRTKSAEEIVDAMSAIEELNHNVTDVIMRPRGYNDLMLSQSAGSTSGIYSLPGGLVKTGDNGQLYIGGVPARKTTAMVANSFLLGDFQSACQLLLREDPIVEFFEQDGDNVKNNQITVRVEARVALPCFYSDALVHGTFVNPGS